MSLFLRFVKCPGRAISCAKRFYWTSHSFTFRGGLGIRYFIPRTADTRADIQTERTGDRDSMPEEFKVIYNFAHEDAVGIVSYCALAFATIFIYIIYNPNSVMELPKIEEENKPISEEPVLDDSYTPSGVIEEIKTLSDSLLENQSFYSGDPRAKSLIGLAMIMAFFYVRSRCVLKIYRHNDDYVTVLFQALGLGKRVIEHTASDCCYYPKRKFFNYNLIGKNIIIFPDLFVSHEERQLYIGRKSK